MIVSVKIHQKSLDMDIKEVGTFHGRRPISRKLSRPWNRELGLRCTVNSSHDFRRFLGVTSWLYPDNPWQTHRHTDRHRITANTAPSLYVEKVCMTQVYDGARHFLEISRPREIPPRSYDPLAPHRIVRFSAVIIPVAVLCWGTAPLPKILPSPSPNFFRVI